MENESKVNATHRETEKQRMATFLNSPELFKEGIGFLHANSWTLDANQWIWKKAMEHYSLHANVPTIDILHGYNEANNIGRELDVLRLNVASFLNEYRGQSVQDGEFFKDAMMKEALDARIKQTVYEHSCTGDWMALRNDIDGLLSKKQPAQRRIYSLSKIKEQRSTMGDVLLNDGLLCRKEGIIIAGPQGSGKSTLITQLAIAWAQGKECLGFRPKKHLKVLILQCEDGQMKLEKMYNDITSQIGSPEDNVIQIDETYPSVDELFNSLNLAMTDHTPDIVVINPFFGYLRGDMNNNSETQDFLYNRFSSLLQRHNAGGIIIHHLTKDKANVYGSAVLGAWGRDTIRIDEMDVVKHVYKMSFLKRTYEYGARSVMIEWSNDNLLFWRLTSDASSSSKDSHLKILSFFNGDEEELSVADLLLKAKAVGWSISMRGLRDNVNELVSLGNLRAIEGRNNLNQPVSFYSLLINQ